MSASADYNLMVSGASEDLERFFSDPRRFEPRGHYERSLGSTSLRPTGNGRGAQTTLTSGMPSSHSIVVTASSSGM